MKWKNVKKKILAVGLLSAFVTRNKKDEEEEDEDGEKTAAAE